MDIDISGLLVKIGVDDHDKRILGEAESVSHFLSLYLIVGIAEAEHRVRKFENLKIIFAQLHAPTALPPCAGQLRSEATPMDT